MKVCVIIDELKSIRNRYSMKNVIKNYCENDKIKNGLVLLDMPTGSGKTHSVLDFIHDYIVACGEKKIFLLQLVEESSRG